MRIIGGKAKGTKLYTLEGNDITRPTLDRVKESVFNIIQKDLEDIVILDLFSGSGAIALEALSRGAKKAIICDKSKDAIKIIKKNIEKCHMEEKVIVYNLEFNKCLEIVENEPIDLIYLDPPYNENYIKKSLELIQKLNIGNDNLKIIIETDEEDRILKEIENLEFKIIDRRKYGRAIIIFLEK